MLFVPQEKTNKKSDLTVADKVFLGHVGHIEAPHVGGGHALSEGGQASPRPQPIREPRQLTVTVEVVGVQAALTTGF